MGADSLIDDYVEHLDIALRPLGRRARRRIVCEVRAHLVDATVDVGEHAAIERFGSADEVGRAYVEVASVRAPRRAIVVFGTAGIGYGLIQTLASPPTFGLFPSGPWPNDQPPPHLAWKVDLAAALIAIAFLIGIAAIVVAWRRRGRPIADRTTVVRLALVGSLVFVASWPFEAMFLFQRSHEVAGSPGDAVVALVALGLLAFQAATVVSAAASMRLVRAATR